MYELAREVIVRYDISRFIPVALYETWQLTTEIVVFKIYGLGL